MTPIFGARNQHRLRDYEDFEGHLLPKVNWGRGRLRPHQSFLSFAAEFCALNQIKPARFRDYWEKSFPLAENDNDPAVSRIAGLLDEPRAVVETVFGSDRRDISQSYLHDDAPWKGTLSYCPDCIATGFHGFFHENPRLRRCPIHGTELFRELLFSNAPSRTDQYVLTLTRLFEQALETWPAGEGKSMPRVDWNGESLIGELLRWEDSVRHAMVDWHGLNCFIQDAPKPYRFSHLDIRLGRLAWSSPMSDRLSDLFVVKPWIASPVIHQCHDDLASEMAGLVDGLNLALLLWTYRTSCLLKGEVTPSSAIAADAVETFLSDHQPDGCKCIWGKAKYEPWARYKPGVMRDYHSAMCPYRHAAEELRAEWVCALPGSSKRRETTVSAYRQCVDLLVERRLGYVTGELLHAWLKVPLVHLRCSQDAVQLLETILDALVKAHIEELARWLAAIQTGILPGSRDCLPSSVFLVRNLRGIDSVLVWPAGHGRPFGDEAARAWESGFQARRLALGH